jgi:hypothetical protein
MARREGIAAPGADTDADTDADADADADTDADTDTDAHKAPVTRALRISGNSVDSLAAVLVALGSPTRCAGDGQMEEAGGPGKLDAGKKSIPI